MAKELMEIGGFITSGAEIVNHDASLSGNGTVDSPLGLSNETILWSGDASTATTSMNLSEPLTAFNKVEIWNKGGQIYTIGTTWSGAYTSNTCECEYNRMDRPLSGYKQVIVDLSANPSNWTNIVYLGNKVCCPMRYSTTANNYGITYYLNVNDGETHIYKVVGINRKG